MTRYLINVGLQTTDRDITPADARAVLRAAGITVITSNVLRSSTEPTLIALVAVSPGHLGDAIFQVCDQLGQDCVAVVEQDGGAGQLIGPRAAAWGQFDPAQFLTLSGHRLNAPRKSATGDAYQGHLPGEGVQAHSAGGVYPYVITAQQVGDQILYGVVGPIGTVECTHSYDDACDIARALKTGQYTVVAADPFEAGAAVAKAAARVTSRQVAHDPDRCLLCDFPLPEGPDEAWFSRRDLPVFTAKDLADQLARIDAMRRY